METGAGFQLARSILGQVLRRSERREVAIFVRDSELWIADFVDGRGELVDAATWVQFNCTGASASEARRRMVVESALPLSESLVARIEALHRRGVAPPPAAADCAAAPTRPSLIEGIDATTAFRGEEA